VGTATGGAEFSLLKFDCLDCGVTQSHVAAQLMLANVSFTEAKTGQACDSESTKRQKAQLVVFNQISFEFCIE
jgi:hypothetical protein